MDLNISGTIGNYIDIQSGNSFMQKFIFGDENESGSIFDRFVEGLKEGMKGVSGPVLGVGEDVLDKLDEQWGNTDQGGLLY